MAVAGAAPAAAKADRATYYAKAKRPAKGGYAARTRDDLVGGVATGSMKLDDVKSEDLPAEMRGMNKDQLKAEIEKRAAARTEAQKKIEELSKKRDEYITAHGKAADAGEAGFDSKVKATIEKQLK